MEGALLNTGLNTTNGPFKKSKGSTMRDFVFRGCISFQLVILFTIKTIHIDSICDDNHDRYSLDLRLFFCLFRYMKPGWIEELEY